MYNNNRFFLDSSSSMKATWSMGSISNTLTTTAASAASIAKNAATTITSATWTSTPTGVTVHPTRASLPTGRHASAATRSQCYITFYGRNKLDRLSPGRPFQSSLMSVRKARSLPKSGASERCFTRAGSYLTCKHWIRLERPAGDRHSTLLQAFLNNGRKKLYKIRPRSQYYINFYGRKF